MNNTNQNTSIVMRDQDMDMLKTLIQHTAKEIYDAMISTSGYYIAQNADETLQPILLMKV